MPKNVLSTLTALFTVLIAGHAPGAEPTREAVRILLDEEDSARAWSGLLPDEESAKEGKLGWKWNTKGSMACNFNPKEDLTKYNELRLWMHSAEANGQSLRLLLIDPGPNGDGDYWSKIFVVDWSGWKQLRFPLERMDKVRSPNGMKGVSRIFFPVGAWEVKMKPDTRLAIDRVELAEGPRGPGAQSAILKPGDPGFKPGPRLGDPDLFHALDLELPALAAVKQAVSRQAWTEARQKFGAWLRSRPGRFCEYDPHRIDREVSFSQKGAEAALAGAATEIAIPYTFPGGKRDWYFTPTGKSGLAPNAEWQWQHNRMGWWANLGRAYWATGNEAYAQKWVEEMRSWTVQCPVWTENFNASGSPWRTIESGIRMSGSWQTVFRFLDSPSVTDDDLCRWAACCLEHARHLSSNFTRGNWLTMEMSGLYTVGVVLPEFKEAAAWRKQAVDSLYREFSSQFLPDGAQNELSPGYHLVALDNILLLVKMARLTGRLGEFPPDFTARAEAAYDYVMYLMTPDRSIPPFNDSWPMPVAKVLSGATNLFPKRDDFRFIASEGKEGKPPPHASHPFPWAGYLVMRSGWERDANYLAFDVGPLGAGHQHQDKLNLVLHAFGREILFDGGGGSYESSKYRAFATDTFGHNTVLVDGLPQRRDRKDPKSLVLEKPVECGWRSTPSYDFAFGNYDDAYGDGKPATHRRSVLFLKPDLAVVLDRLVSVDGKPHRYEARWHLFPTEIETKGPIVVTAEREKPNLAVVPLATEGLELVTASGQLEPELLGWFVYKDHNPQYIKATTVCHRREGAGMQLFATLLIPLKPGADNPVRTSKQEGRTFQVVLEDGRILRIAIDEKGETMDISETLANGKPGRSFK